MPHKRYANAIMSRQNIAFGEWMEEYRDQHEGAIPKNHVNRIANTVLRKCDPKKYLLSHATIVASVDTYAPKGVRTGTQLNRGVQIDVRWPDFRIKPECHEIINNNGDAWSRSLLLSTYRTFVGAQNYLEHIQIPDLSKGFIVDAIARDLGKTCYVDILVATDRKHKKLVSDILSGQISALSMGCVSLFTICTWCGNVAADDSCLCPCVQSIGKGQIMADEDGVSHPISELIGHVQVPNSNQFIEASWVRNPAFRGAVRRNFLNPNSEIIAGKLSDAKKVFEIRRNDVLEGVMKAASKSRLAQEDDPIEKLEESGPDDAESDESEDDIDLGGSEGSEDSDSSESSSNPSPDDSKLNTKDLLEDAQKKIVEILLQNLTEQLAPKPKDVGVAVPAPSAPGPGVMDLNDNLVQSSDDFTRKLHQKFPKNPALVKWATYANNVVKEGRSSIQSNRLSSRDLIILSWIYDRVASRSYPSNLYKIAMEIGSLKDFPSEISFLAACRMKMGRNLSQSEQDFLRNKGRIASLASRLLGH